MATITSAGAGSGIDLESVISASVAAKKTQLQQPITTKKTNTQITLTGVGQLKSAISTFDTTLAKLSTPGAFNKRAINITQDTDDPILKIAPTPMLRMVSTMSPSTNWRPPARLRAPSQARPPR